MSSASPFLISVDDAGRFLLVRSSSVLLGHLRGGSADLPFLADLAPEHARLERSDSFHAGPLWSVTPVGDEEVRCNDERVLGTRALRSGDELRLGNVVLRFRMPDPASQSALLELLNGVECGGAQRVLLVADGPAGRVRIGAAKQGHVKLRGLERDVVLVLEEGWLRLSEARSPIDAEGGQGAEDGARAPLDVELALPPTAWVYAALSHGDGARPPLSLGIGPAELPPPAVPTQDESGRAGAEAR